MRHIPEMRKWQVKELGPDFLLNNRHLWLRSKRHAYSQFMSSLIYRIRNDTEYSDRPENQGYSCKSAEQKHRETSARKRVR